MIPRWPDDLPGRFERTGHQGSRGDGRLRSPTDTGPGKTRLRSRAVSDPMEGRLRMRGAQIERYRRFEADEIAGGSLPFIFPDPMGGLPLFVQLGDTMPSWTPLAGDLWDFRLRLEVIRTGAIVPGLPALPTGYAYVTVSGAYLLRDRVPLIVRVP